MTTLFKPFLEEIGIQSRWKFHFLSEVLKQLLVDFGFVQMVIKYRFLNINAKKLIELTTE